MHACVFVLVPIFFRHSININDKTDLKDTKPRQKSRKKGRKNKEERDNLTLTNSHTYMKSYCRNGGGRKEKETTVSTVHNH